VMVIQLASGASVVRNLRLPILISYYFPLY
jgi:hypothetical protein